jgi:hypothetical protein
MTIDVTTTRMPPYAGNGVAQDFPFAFRILSTEHLRVTLTTVNGVATVLTLGQHYSVTGTRQPAGNVHMFTAPATGESLTIRRQVPLLQLLDASESTDIPPQVVEDALDQVYSILLELADTIGASAGTSRFLALGDADVDGSGAYRAKQNRVQDLADPVGAQDAVNRRFAEALLQAAAQGLASILPLSWRVVAPGGTASIQVPGALLSPSALYDVSIDGIHQPPEDFTVNLSTNPPTIVFSENVPAGLPVSVVCRGYSLPVQPLAGYTLGTRPAATVELAGAGAQVLITLANGAQMVQRCLMNSDGDPEWVTGFAAS